MAQRDWNVDDRLTRPGWAPHQLAIQRAMHPEAFGLDSPPLPVYLVRHRCGTTLDITTDWLAARRLAAANQADFYERRGQILCRQLVRSHSKFS